MSGARIHECVRIYCMLSSDLLTEYALLVCHQNVFYPLAFFWPGMFIKAAGAQVYSPTSIVF